MVQPDPITDINNELPSLWLVVVVGSQTHTFELEHGVARPITVGSASHADIQLKGVDVPPIICYFEREQDAVLLVPAYRSHSLRCDTSVVERPRRIWRRSVIEIPGVALSVRVRHEPPTSPNCERVLPPDVGPVAANTELQSGSGAEEELRGYRNAVAFESDARDVPTLSRIARSNEVSGNPTGDALGVIPGAPIVDVEGDWERDCWGSTEHGRPNRLRPPINGDAETVAESGPMSTGPAVVTIRPTARTATNPLATVGNLANDRPKLVMSCAALGAVALALAMVGASRLYDAATLAASYRTVASNGADTAMRTVPSPSPMTAIVAGRPVPESEVAQPSASATATNAADHLVPQAQIERAMPVGRTEELPRRPSSGPGLAGKGVVSGSDERRVNQR